MASFRTTRKHWPQLITFLQKNAADGPPGSDHLDALLRFFDRIEPTDDRPQEDPCYQLSTSASIDWQEIESILRTPRDPDRSPQPIEMFLNFQRRESAQNIPIQFAALPLMEPRPHPWVNQRQFASALLTSAWDKVRLDSKGLWPTATPVPGALCAKEYPARECSISNFLPGNVAMGDDHRRRTFAPRVCYLDSINAIGMLTTLLPNPAHSIRGVGVLQQTSGSPEAEVKEARENLMRMAAQTVHCHLLNYCLALLLADHTSIAYFRRMMEMLVQTIPISADQKGSFAQPTTITVFTLTA